MAEKQLSFKMGAEHNRGAIYVYQNSGSQAVTPNEGQVLFGYSEIDSTKYPYMSNIYNQLVRPKYDARIYLDLNISTSGATGRTPISSYFSDYSSKLWDLSTGTEFTIGNNSQPIYFKDGIPITAGFTIDTISTNIGTVGTTLGVYPIQLGTVGTNTIHAAVKIPEAQEDVAGLMTKNYQAFNGNKDFNGIIHILNTNQASTLTNGALVVDGGIGVSKTSYMNTIYSGNIYPRDSGTYVLGNTAKTWNSIHSSYFNIYRGADGGKIYTQQNSSSERYTVAVLGNATISTNTSGRYGILQIYSTGTGYQRLRAHTDVVSGTTYLRNHGNTAYIVATTTTNAVGGETKIEEVSNGDKPVYISDKGVATACNGIIVTEGEQTFTGSKTFNTQLIINNADDISLSTISEAAFIVKNSQYTMGFDSNEILVSKADGTSSVLYLNDGGEVQIDGTFHLQQAGNYGSTLPTTNLRAGRVYFQIID